MVKLRIVKVGKKEYYYKIEYIYDPKRKRTIQKRIGTLTNEEIKLFKENKLKIEKVGA